MSPKNSKMQILQHAMATKTSVHRGHRLCASAQPAPAGLHSSDLIIEVPGRPPQAFTSLDFFYDHEQAIDYATAWGRIWVDSRV